MRVRTVFTICAALVVLMSCSSATSPSCTAACVTIQDFSFSPATLSVKAGTTVQWNNNGPSSHTTTSDNAMWDSGALAGPSGGGAYGGAPGGSFQFTFNSPGSLSLSLQAASADHRDVRRLYGGDYGDAVSASLAVGGSGEL